MTHQPLTGHARRPASARTAALLLISLQGIACAGADWSDVLGGDEVRLGAAARSVDLSRCLNADCRPEKTERQPLPAEERSCDPGPAEELETVRFRELVREVECPEAEAGATCTTSDGIMGVGCDDLVACSAIAGDIALAPDRTLWVVIDVNGTDPSTDRAASGVWMVHQADDGSVLSARMLVIESRPAPTFASVNARLSVDARGHAFVLVTRTVGEEADGYIDWSSDIVFEHELIELDDTGRELGSRIPIVLRPNAPSRYLERGLMIASMGPGLILGELRVGSGSIGLLDRVSKTVRWVQTREQRLGLHDLVSDAAGEITILTRAPNSQLSGRIERYTPNGQLAWEHAWNEPGPTASPVSSLGIGNMTIDAAGTLRIAEQSGRSESAVHWITADGTSRSTTRLHASELAENEAGWTGSDPRGISLLTAQNTLLINQGAMLLDGTVGASYLYELSEDAITCRLYTWSGRPERLSRIRADAGRQLHFITDHGYGLLQLPEAP